MYILTTWRAQHCKKFKYVYFSYLFCFIIKLARLRSGQLFNTVFWTIPCSSFVFFTNKRLPLKTKQTFSFVFCTYFTDILVRTKKLVSRCNSNWKYDSLKVFCAFKQEVNVVNSIELAHHQICGYPQFVNDNKNNTVTIFITCPCEIRAYTHYTITIPWGCIKQTPPRWITIKTAQQHPTHRSFHVTANTNVSVWFIRAGRYRFTTIGRPSSTK